MRFLPRARVFFLSSSLPSPTPPPPPPLNDNEERCCYAVVLSVRSGARSEVESRSRASTWLKRRASGVTPAASAASAATWQAARREQAEAGAVYHLGCRSRWDIGRPAKSTRSTFWQPASRIAPSGYVPSVPVSLSFFLSSFFFLRSYNCIFLRFSLCSIYIYIYTG